MSVRGLYVNNVYGYSVRIPANLRGYRMRAPAPQHGITIYLGGAPQDRLWVNGEYDVLLLGSADALATQTAETLGKEYGLSVVKNVPTRLSALDAREVVLMREGVEAKINYIHFVAALRNVPKEVGIAYLIVIESHAKNGTAESVFSAVVSSFLLTQPPN